MGFFQTSSDREGAGLVRNNFSTTTGGLCSLDSVNGKFEYIVNNGVGLKTVLTLLCGLG